MLPAVVRPFALHEGWSYEIGDKVRALAFSDSGLLGVASWNSCVYIFDQDGKLLNKECGLGWMTDASCSGEVFGFTNASGYAYLFKGSAFWKEVKVGNYYSSAIAVLSDGFIVCGWRCALFDFSGNRKWDATVKYVVNSPAVSEEYAYVADGYALRILKLSDGSEVREISSEEYAWNTAVCRNYLAVGTSSHLYLYDISDPESPAELWKAGGFVTVWDIAFSPDCRYVAVADANNQELRIFGINGRLILEKKYGAPVTAVAWWEDKIAVGLSINA